MLSRRGHRLSRFRKNKRHLRDRLRQRIFFRDRVVPELMEKPRVLVLTGAGISAESGIRTFRAADGLWEEHRVEDVATPEGFSRNPELVQSFYNARRHQLQQPEIQPNAAHIALAKLEAELGVEIFQRARRNIKATEAGELLEALHATAYRGETFDVANAGEEIGDGFWYDALLARACGLTFDGIQRTNIAKLRHRFPDHFTEYDANNRDLFGERRILEEGEKTSS